MFKEYYHRKLWELIKNSWHSVKELGFVNTKKFLRMCYLNDHSDIPNSCYACLYAKEKSNSALVNMCKYCPLEIEICSSSNSIYRRLCKAIKIGDKTKFKELCDVMKNAKIKPNVECEVIGHETDANQPSSV